MSMRPGATINPLASISSIADFWLRIANCSATRPFAITRSPISSRSFAGSMMRPLRMMVVFISGEHRLLACSWRQLAANVCLLSFLTYARSRSASCRTQQAGSLRSPQRCADLASCRDPSAQIQDCHAHGQTVGHLIENDALISIGQLAVDLDSAIDRARMHDQTIGLQ